jgi:hypothetical protein
MTSIAPQEALPPACPKASSSARGVPLTRVYLPFAMVVSFGIFLLIGGYTIGNVMSGIARDKTETEKRLTAIEKEVTAIKNILADRAATPPACLARPK